MRNGKAQVRGLERDGAAFFRDNPRAILPAEIFSTVGHKGPATLPGHDDSFVFQFAVHLQHRIGVDRQICRQLPYRRQLVGRPQCARCDQESYLSHDLRVDRRRVRLVDSQMHSVIPQPDIVILN